MDENLGIVGIIGQDVAELTARPAFTPKMRVDNFLPAPDDQHAEHFRAIELTHNAVDFQRSYMVDNDRAGIDLGERGDGEHDYGIHADSVNQHKRRINCSTIRHTIYPMAHYPTGCSKYNPIEHRMFCHVSRALQGVPLDSIDTAKRFIEQTRTRPGLSVIAEQATRLYSKGIQAIAAFLESFPIVLDAFLSRYNYLATSEAY